MHDVVARQVSRQRLADGLADINARRRDPSGGNFRLDLFKRELQLLDLARDLLRRAAELHPAKPRQLDLGPLVQELVGGAIGIDLDQQRLQEGGIVGQGTVKLTSIWFVKQWDGPKSPWYAQFGMEYLSHNTERSQYSKANRTGLTKCANGGSVALTVPMYAM